MVGDVWGSDRVVRDGVRCGIMWTGGKGAGSAGVCDGEGEGVRCGIMWTGGKDIGSSGVWRG